ncbi:Clp protease N-terminal domain-containing protein [Streptomyces sp. 21So2-11]|uniref:Clp protease N-terminal domain-containing protein n=1 Tax=Streptomyces sp. 21So2-11 TaxID=3144408 RepID=UPI0032194CDC
MFERFTKSARGVVEGAVGHAERMDAAAVTEEHLLLALLDQEGTRSSFAFASLGVTGQRGAVAGALEAARRRGGLSKADEDALAGIGIDVEGIVARVEETHGSGAMLGGGKPRRWWSGRRPFGRAAKGTLEKSLRVALGRGDRFIGDEHLLLALTTQPGVVADVLAEYGVTYASAEQALFGTGGEGVAKAG